ncbi:oligopeptide ABC transporter permease [Cytobacillus horneckiae]|uniref:oligopeptide ABC transporter permease n=1 Tax=Cytobacillus horneckiae TaxID=549687 RepID=UPI0008256700|nr:oligopeptide ABC transporter permease [Cytobacillus horneckiae]MCM3178603.1 ABC transporter permease [Cytobacillus horneckiae]MEC1155576.1 ABC transporter permease [Cytobacillus horneckiae]MED2936895.1 ABC transporter permease [Cytobacillus horneckiae]
MSQTNPEISQSELELNPNLTEKPETLTKIFLRKFMKNKLAVIGAVFLFIIILASILAPVITPYSFEQVNLMAKLHPPSADYWLGTDRYGRDIFTRLMYGGQISLMVAFGSVIGALIIGVSIGALAGYYGGIIDAILMRIVDIVISIPSIFLLITIVTIFKPSVGNLIIVFALTSWTSTARLVRGEFLSLRSREFVLASKTIGTKSYKIIFSHILPNAMAPIIVAATLLVGSVILAEAGLSYLGLGVQPPLASWGNMLQDAQNYTVMLTAPWYPIFPGLLILLTVLSFNFVGDGLRDALDPKSIE